MIIYLVTNKANGKQYVGQTTRPLSERWRRHCHPDKLCYFQRAIQKYGPDNFEIRVIDTATSKAELDEKEIHWIKKLNTMYPYGYNLKPGGNVSMLGVCGKLNPKSRLIYQFTSDGRVVNKYWGAAEASRITGLSDVVILRALKSDGGYRAGGCMWMYASDFPEKVTDRLSNYQRRKCTPVLCVETGERFDSFADAARKYGLLYTSISACCAGRQKTTGGYHWEKIKEGDV